VASSRLKTQTSCKNTCKSTQRQVAWLCLQLKTKEHLQLPGTTWAWSRKNKLRLAVVSPQPQTVMKKERGSRQGEQPLAQLLRIVETWHRLTTSRGACMLKSITQRRTPRDTSCKASLTLHLCAKNCFATSMVWERTSQFSCRKLAQSIRDFLAWLPPATRDRMLVIWQRLMKLNA